MRRMLRYFLPVPLLLFACNAERGVRDIPRCPPCPCLRDLGEARDLAVRPDLAAPSDLAAPQDMSVPPDLSCAPLGRTCVDLPCCAPLVCIGGACASFPVR